MDDVTRRFACTACGKCCDRAPEVELSEAAPLADMFVFRLLFRLYRLPSSLRDYVDEKMPPRAAGEQFYQRKRLLAACAARKSKSKLSRSGKAVEHDDYLIVSALALDSGTGSCAALANGRCSIYERRPFACRTAPFHYSRIEASLGGYLDAFVGTPGYACDSGDSAPVVIDHGLLADSGIRSERDQALALVRRDAPWHRAIVHRMKTARWNDAGLPSLRDVEANAPLGATGTSMRIAWRIAVEAGLMGEDECAAAIAAQLRALERELARGNCAPAHRQTLEEMSAEYRLSLQPAAVFSDLRDDVNGCIGDDYGAPNH